MSWLLRVMVCVVVTLVVSPVFGEWQIVKEIKLPAPTCQSFDIDKTGSRVAYTSPARNRLLIETGVEKILVSKAYVYNVRSGEETPLVRKGKHVAAGNVVFSRTRPELLTLSTMFMVWNVNGSFDRKFDTSIAGWRIFRPQRSTHFLTVNKNTFDICSDSGGFNNQNLGQTIVEAAAISADGKHAFTTGGRQIVKWTTGPASRAKEREIHLGLPHEPEDMKFVDMACSADGAEFVLATSDGRLLQYSGTDSATLPSGTNGEVGISCVAMSPSGAWVVCGRMVTAQNPTVASDGQLVPDKGPEIAVCHNGAFTGRLSDHRTDILETFFVDETTLVSTDKSGLIIIWNLDSGSKQLIQGKGPGAVSGDGNVIALSADGKTIGVLQQGVILLLKQISSGGEPGRAITAKQ